MMDELSVISSNRIEQFSYLYHCSNTRKFLNFFLGIQNIPLMINEGLVYAFLLVAIRGSDLLVKHERFLDLLALIFPFPGLLL